jgi:hypothetical protein
MQVKGRFFVLGWGAVFLAVAGTIALRQYHAFTTVSEVSVLADSLQAIRSVHGDLTGTLAGMQSPELLVPRAESLGLRQPTEGEQVPLSLPAR